MPTELISPEEFLTRLEGCFSGPSGTVWLTHKRYDHEVDVQMGDEGEEYDVLIRCTQGDTSKFSARIPSTRISEFHIKYGSLLKASMAPTMRKRDKKKEKAKSEALALKKRELYVDVEIPSKGKRGKGRRQRQRKIAAQKRKETERERVENKGSTGNSAKQPL